jgi:hypothetical protein
MASFLGEYARHFKLDTPEDGEVWAVVDVKYGRKYEIPSPDRHAATYYDENDWGIIEKARKDARWYFFICGLGDRATRGCAYYLARNWEDLLDRHLDHPFAELIRFPGGFGPDYKRSERVDRANNKFGKPVSLESSNSSQTSQAP